MIKDYEPKYIKPIERTRNELAWALSNLRSACELWELNRFEQTENIATILRLLIHDTENTKNKKQNQRPTISLLTQLQMRNVDFFSTPAISIPAPGQKPSIVMATAQGQATMMVEGNKKYLEARWIPLYHRARQPQDNIFNLAFKSPWTPVPFAEWWRAVVLQADGHEFSRAGLVYTLANRLGGAHSDQWITSKELALLEEKFGYGFTNFTISGWGQSAKPINAVYHAAIRQIAYELQRTIAHHFPERFPPDSVVPPLPFEWTSAALEESPIRIVSDPAYDAQVMEQIVQSDGLWSGHAEELRAKAYWAKFKESLHKAGL